MLYVGGPPNICEYVHMLEPPKKRKKGKGEGMRTGRDDADHDTRTVPITTSKQQELTTVCPEQ